MMNHSNVVHHVNDSNLLYDFLEHGINDLAPSISEDTLLYAIICLVNKLISIPLNKEL